MARPLVFLERVLMRFPAGTLARIKAAVGDAADRSAFIRDAVEGELRRREASGTPVPQPASSATETRDKRSGKIPPRERTLFEWVHVSPGQDARYPHAMLCQVVEGEGGLRVAQSKPLYARDDPAAAAMIAAALALQSGLAERIKRKA